MALPSEVFRASTNSSAFLYPDNLPYTDTVKNELGGVAFNDGTQGLQVHPWQSRYDSVSGVIYLKNMVTLVENATITVPNVVSLSFSFDANMRPVIGYKKADGSCYFYWFNIVTNNYVTTTLPAGTSYVLVTHDDKRRIGQLANYSDVLVFYLNANKIYCLYQRERYQTAHQIATVSAGTQMLHVGMCTDLRIRIELKNGSFISSP
jgi:hypothetical protein